MRATFFILVIVIASLPFGSTSGGPPIEQLQQLTKSAEGFLTANDRPAASEVAAKIIDACTRGMSTDDDDDGAFSADDPRRVGFLLFAARLDIGLGNHQRALETLHTIMADGKPGSIDRLQAEAFLLQFKIHGGQEYLDDAIGLLAHSSELTDADKQIRDDIQNLVFDAIIKAFATRTIKHPQLVEELEQIEQRMIDLGVPFGVAKLTRFAEAAALKNDRADLLEDTLNNLQNIVTDNRVSAFLRAQYWNLRADLYQQRGHYADAFDACREFERNAAMANRNDLIDIARDQSALVALRIGDFAEAKKAYESTREFHTSPSPASNDDERRFRLKNATYWRVNLAKAMEGSNEFMSARALLNEAMVSLQDDDPSLRELVALVDNNLGLNHYLTGQFELAAELMDRAKERYQEIGGFDVWVAESTVNLGWISLGKNDPEAAAKHFAEAARIFAEHLPQEHPRIAEAITYQARVAAQLGRLDDARRWIEQAENRVYHRICRDLASSGSMRDRIALVQEARVHPESIAWPGTIDTYLELAPQLEIPPEQQYEVVLRWKGLIQRFDQDHAGPNSDHAQLEREIKAKLHEAYFRPVSFLKRRALRQEIDQFETQLRQLQRAQRSRQAFDADSRQTSIKAVAARLQPDDLFLDIFQIRTFRPPSRQALVGSGRQYVAFTLAHDGAVERFAFGAADILDAAIIRWGNTITERSRQMSASELQEHRLRMDAAAGEVARMVQQPILRTGSPVDRLTIRPDGATHLIPWAALPGTDGKKYWIENIRLQIGNGAELQDAATNTRQPQSLLVVGGVDFGQLKQYKPLPGSMNEKVQVAQLFRSQFGGDSVVELDQRAANEAALLREMPNRDFIHLATHGFYQRRDESDVFGVTGVTTLLQTGLVVAPDDDAYPQHDQYLTAAEIGDIDLSRASLVMLSACESSLGQALAGQGVQGMLGSFHAAGASCVIGTLWIVDDAATVTMVLRFYHHLWERSLPPADALRAAQLDMIHTPVDVQNAELLSHPYAWAAFICSAK